MKQKAGIVKPLFRRVIINQDGDNMIRTQVSLEEDEYEFAKAQAAALGISVAEFIRRAIREQLSAPGEGAWMRYAGFIETGDPHSSASVDELVYGSKH